MEHFSVEGVETEIRSNVSPDLEEENNLLRSELARKQQQLDVAMRVAAVARADMKRLESTVKKTMKNGGKINLDESVPFIDNSTPDGNVLASRIDKR